MVTYILILVFLSILMVDWLWIHRITRNWMNKLWIVVSLACFYLVWKLIHIDNMQIAFVAIVYFVFGIGYLLIGLNRLVRRPFGH